MFNNFIGVFFRTEVCCGIIFKGLNGEVLLDPQLLHPCLSCKTGRNRRTGELRRSQSTDDTESNSSANSYNGDAEYLDNTCGDIDSLNGDTQDLTISSFQCGGGENQPVTSFTHPAPLLMEC